jgi:phosphonate transport system permease protein
MTVAAPSGTDTTHEVHAAWQRLAMQRRLYTFIGIAAVFVALCWSLWFADDSNSGHFADRWPHLFDFVSWLVPHDWNDVWRALFDIASPADNGTQEFNFPEGSVPLWGNLYIPEYFHLMITTINIAAVSTIIGFLGGVTLCFLAAKNTMAFAPIRFIVRRVMETLRAFPEIVIAGLFAAVLSLGPLAAIVAVALHTIGALGKLYFEVVENMDMGADEGLKASGGNWLERMRFAAIPQVLPNFMSYAMLRFEINVRASTIIGAVGGGGIGEELRLSISRGFGAKTVALVGLLLVTVIVVDQLSAYIRRKLVGDQAFNMTA